MKKKLFSLYTVVLIFSAQLIQAQCLEVTSIFVNACQGQANEGDNEMFSFTVGATPIAIADITVNWGTGNSFDGWCFNSVSTASLNANITNNCGFFIEPVSGILPANADVLVITSEFFSLIDNDFSNLSDTLYILYQCGSTAPGHFSNSANNTLTVTTANSCAGVESVSYIASSLVGGDGATVFFDASGNGTYVNNGCNAPIVTFSVGWSFTNAICNTYGVVDLNNLLSGNATTGGTWSGPRVSGSTYNPNGYLGLDSINYSINGSGSCLASSDSTIVFNVVQTTTGSFNTQSCDSVYFNGTWYTTSISFVDTIIGTGYACDSITNVTISIQNAIIDSNYIAACSSVTFNGNTYSSSTILRDTIFGNTGTGSSCSQLFFSEYIEGSSNNKALEIYNGTGLPVNLANYTIERYTNGSVTASLPTLTLSGTLADGDVYVIYNSSATNATLLAQGDLATGYINHNGNDAYALLFNGNIIDVFGNIGCDPGAEWTDLGNGTQDNGYYRQPNYTAVATDPANAPCNMPSLNATNWVSTDALDNFSNIGSHNANCGSVATSTCDSIFITNIDIASPAVTNTVNACTNNPALAGTVNNTIFNINGCDSIITTTITSLVTPSTIPVNLSGCSSVSYNSVTYNTSTSFSDTTLSSLGCDSVYTNVNIVVNQEVSVQNPGNPFIICSTDSVLLPGGTYASSSGTYSFTTTGANSCDSTISTTVVVQNCNLTCTFAPILFDSYEYDSVIPGIIPGTFIHTSPRGTTSPFIGLDRTGTRFAYFNFQGTPGNVFYNRYLDVCPGTEFRYSFWIRQFDNNPGSNITINVYDGPNNTFPLINSQNIINSGTVYNQRTSPILVASGNIVTLEFIDNLGGPIVGNDLCLDDFLFEMCMLDTIYQTLPYCNNVSSFNLYDALIPTPGQTGTWTGPSTLTNTYLGTFNPASNTAGTYIYTASSGSACSDTIFAITTTSISSLIGIDNLAACDSISYNNITYTSSQTIFDTITAGAANGCDSVFQVNLQVLNSVTVNNINNPLIICASNDSVQLPDGSFATTAGTYPITYVSNASCDSTYVTVVETQICNCEFDLGPDTAFCQGGSIVLDASPGFDSYTWQDNSSAQTFTANSSGTYYCTTTYLDLNNNLVSNGDFQQGNTGFTTNYILGTGGPWGQISNAGTYAINTNSNNVHSNFFSCNDHTTGTGNMMIVNGANTPNTNVWCQNITVNPNTDYLFSAWAMSLENTNISNVATLHFLINGVQFGPNFSPSFTACAWQQFSTTWNSGANVNIQICIESDVISGNNDYAIDDIFFTPSCNYTDTIEVTVNQFPTPNLGPDQALCQGASTTLNATTPNATYLWQDGSTTTATFTTSTPGIYWVDVTTNSCTARDSVEVTVNAVLQTNISTTICDGDSAFLDGAWQFNAGTYSDTLVSASSCDSIVNTTLNVQTVNTLPTTITSACANELPVTIFGVAQSAAGTYADTIQSSLGCDSIIRSIQLVINPTTNDTVNVDICEGDSFLINGSFFYTNGIYSNGTSIGGNGCDQFDFIDLNVNPVPTAILGNDTTINEGDFLSISVLNGSANESYSWLNSLGENYTGASINPNNVESASYFVTIENAFACFSVDTLEVFVIPKVETLLFMPTAFSPNGDGYNDVFRIANFDEFESYTLKIYNRWGELIFDNQGYNVAWDGTYKGVNQNIGAYAYYISATTLSGEVMVVSGNVTLIR